VGPQLAGASFGASFARSALCSAGARGGTRVGIGVATGNDTVYIVGEDVDIERDRLVPVVMREDLEKGHIREARQFVINTFGEGGKVIDLRAYPKLTAYLNAHVSALKKRHLAKKNTAAWFCTLDWVYPERVGVEKLLLPDIARSNNVVYERGRFHPHHNLYFITSTGWDLEALGGLLSSKVALFFVWSYAVKMRGGYLRFQAQYLRRIRLPSPNSVGHRLIRALRDAFRKRDFATLDELALRAYGLEELPAFPFVDTRT
jgi:adenine-specific DNA-methyltransferase